MIYIVIGIFILFWTSSIVVYKCCDGISKKEAIMATLLAFMVVALVVTSVHLIIKGIVSLC